MEKSSHDDRQSDASLLVYAPRKCPPLLSLSYQPIVDYSDRLTSDSKHDLLNKRVHSLTCSLFVRCKLFIGIDGSKEKKKKKNRIYKISRANFQFLFPFPAQRLYLSSCNLKYTRAKFISHTRVREPVSHLEYAMTVGPKYIRSTNKKRAPSKFTFPFFP